MPTLQDGVAVVRTPDGAISLLPPASMIVHLDAELCRDSRDSASIGVQACLAARSPGFLLLCTSAREVIGFLKG